MKKSILVIQIVLTISLFQTKSFSQQIIADHTVVDKYSDIPQFYLNKVKEMWITLPGESHSYGYRKGCELLATLDPDYSVSILESGTPEGYTNEHLRLSKATWGDVNDAAGWRYGYGEEDWYTSALAITRTKDHLTYCNTQNFEIAAMGFGWCWDMTWTNSPGGTIDPVYKVRWAGSSDGGPEGNLIWGLDADDATLTGNSVCMDTYLNATTEYINHCTSNGYSTKVFFTTGPVDGDDNTGENGYQRSIKHDYIRNYVLASTDRILFDYADILCWSNEGVQNTVSWTDYSSTLKTFQYIHSDNMLDLDGTYEEDGDHIGQRGAVRLAKALWWLLARIAGWDGTTTDIKPAYNNSAIISVYPNPVKDIITVQTNETSNECYLSLLNVNGQEQKRQQIKNSSIQIDISNLASGVYFVKLVTAKTIEVRKIIKD